MHLGEFLLLLEQSLFEHLNWRWVAKAETIPEFLILHWERQVFGFHLMTALEESLICYNERRRTLRHCVNFSTAEPGWIASCDKLTAPIRLIDDSTHCSELNLENYFHAYFAPANDRELSYATCCHPSLLACLWCYTRSNINSLINLIKSVIFSGDLLFLWAKFALFTFFQMNFSSPFVACQTLQMARKFESAEICRMHCRSSIIFSSAWREASAMGVSSVWSINYIIWLKIYRTMSSNNRPLFRFEHPSSSPIPY